MGFIFRNKHTGF